MKNKKKNSKTAKQLNNIPIRPKIEVAVGGCVDKEGKFRVSEVTNTEPACMPVSPMMFLLTSDLSM